LHLVGENRWQWNYGDPDCKHVILFDEDVYTGHWRLECLECHIQIRAISVVVLDGVFESISALEDANIDSILGGARHRASAVIVGDDGSYLPQQEWFDHVVVVNAK